ncbi:hypothetical protein Bbelb_074830 [Branchiostoma belcheri]|nr:hypothetical protein Bbelb_074830 [Branchiostoma belcheri]
MPETRDDGKQESARQKNTKSVQFNLSDNTTMLLEPEHELTGGNTAVNGSPYGNHLNHKKPEESNSIMSAEIEKLNEELKALRDKLEEELDDMERYLDKRQEMCNSKDDDLKMLDEELSRLRTELQKNIDSMEEDAVQENAEVIGRLRSDWEALKAKRRQAVSNLVQQTANRLSATSPSAVVSNTAEKTAEGTAVLQAVVRKLQHDLQEAENSMEKKDQEICQLGRKVLFLETELQKRDQKAKQLEAQLTISLGEIRRKESSERQEPSHRKHQDRSANSTQEGHRARSGTWGAESRGSRSSSHRSGEEGPRSDKSSSSSGSRHSIMKEYDMNSTNIACSSNGKCQDRDSDLVESAVLLLEIPIRVSVIRL